MKEIPTPQVANLMGLTQRYFVWQKMTSHSKAGVLICKSIWTKLVPLKMSKRTQANQLKLQTYLIGIKDLKNIQTHFRFIMFKPFNETNLILNQCHDSFKERLDWMAFFQEPYLGNQNDEVQVKVFYFKGQKIIKLPEFRNTLCHPKKWITTCNFTSICQTVFCCWVETDRVIRVDSWIVCLFVYLDHFALKSKKLISDWGFGHQWDRKISAKSKF